MKDNVIAGHVQTPQVSDRISCEIRRALDELKKKGYTVHFEEVPEQRDELAITFNLGETRQTLRIRSGDWSDEGTVYDVVLNRLDI